MPTRYYISLPDPEGRTRQRRRLRFQRAWRRRSSPRSCRRRCAATALFERWRGAQDDPDAVDETLGATDPQATVSGSQDDLRIDLVATTSIPGSVFKHRLRCWPAVWDSRDVTAG